MEALLDELNQEVGDIAPGPERDAKFREVVIRRLETSTNDKEKLFWKSMLEEVPKANGVHVPAEPAPVPPPEPAKEVHDAMREAIFELIEATKDKMPNEVIMRALGTYRSIVRHVKAGGSVVFIDAEGKQKKLKVHLA
jgi:hypothetical protein